MKKLLITTAFLFFVSIHGSEKQDLAFAQEAKKAIREHLNKGRLVHVYENGVLKKRWRNQNLSSEDLLNLTKAYKEASDLERQIILKEKLENNNYIFTEYPERITPLRPTKSLKPVDK